MALISTAPELTLCSWQESATPSRVLEGSWQQLKPGHFVLGFAAPEWEQPQTQPVSPSCSQHLTRTPPQPSPDTHSCWSIPWSAKSATGAVLSLPPEPGCCAVESEQSAAAAGGGFCPGKGQCFIPSGTTEWAWCCHHRMLKSQVWLTASCFVQLSCGGTGTVPKQSEPFSWCPGRKSSGELGGCEKEPEERKSNFTVSSQSWPQAAKMPRVTTQGMLSWFRQSEFAACLFPQHVGWLLTGTALCQGAS